MTGCKLLNDINLYARRDLKSYDEQKYKLDCKSAVSLRAKEREISVEIAQNCRIFRQDAQFQDSRKGRNEI